MVSFTIRYSIFTILSMLSFGTVWFVMPSTARTISCWCKSIAIPVVVHVIRHSNLILNPVCTLYIDCCTYVRLIVYLWPYLCIILPGIRNMERRIGYKKKTVLHELNNDPTNFMMNLNAQCSILSHYFIHYIIIII